MNRRPAGSAYPSCQEIIRRLESLGNPAYLAGMARFGIRAKKAFGVRAPAIKKLARETGRNHRLARELWATGIYDARALAALIEEPELVTESQADCWVRQFDSWAVCDGTCLYLLFKLPFAWRKLFEWSLREREFEKRAAFALAAVLAVHDKSASDKKFLKFLPVIKREANDPRNFVKKAVNWALRQIGKRNLRLNVAAIRTAREIRELGTSPARWIAADALRELTSKAMRTRLLSRAI